MICCTHKHAVLSPPVGPVAPVAPVFPVVPVGPIGPVDPVGVSGQFTITGGQQRHPGQHILPLNIFFIIHLFTPKPTIVLYAAILLLSDYISNTMIDLITSELLTFLSMTQDNRKFYI